MDPARMNAASETLRDELAAIDRTCSRFRADSEISRLRRRAGRTVTVSPLLGEALQVALRAAELTDGLVDPTVADSVSHLGYDRDFALIEPDRTPVGATRAAPGWWRVRWDPDRGEIVLPRGVGLDLGATAKALASDRAARRCAEAAGCGVLVSLGGDLATMGDAPEGGWRIALADDHRQGWDRPDQTVTVTSGGLATSSTVARSWLRDGRRRHHIVDPRTGDNPSPAWRTVTVAAATCVDANTATTAAIVMGASAPGWLDRLGLPARLVSPEGHVVHTADWPNTQEGD
nr:FAD:protein FMN transferase [Pseudonocardia spinosispora]